MTQRVIYHTVNGQLTCWVIQTDEAGVRKTVRLNTTCNRLAGNLPPFFSFRVGVSRSRSGHDPIV